MFRKKEIYNKSMKKWTSKRNKSITIAGIIVLTIMVLLIGTITIKPNIAVNKVKQWKVSDKITTDKFEISIVSIEKRAQVGSGIFESKSAADWVYLTVCWDWKNTSKTSINSIEIPTIQLVDKNGTKYDADLDASMSFATEFDFGTQIFSDLNPGIKISDSNVFEVSEKLLDKGEYKLIINADKELSVDIAVALVNNTKKSQQPSNSNDLNSIGSSYENNNKDVKNNNSTKSKKSNNKVNNNDLIETEKETNKITWDHTMEMNYSISDINLGEQGDTIEFVMGRDTPNRTKVVVISGNQGVNLLREIATFPQAAFDEWGELNEGYKIEACFLDLDEDGEKEILLAIGDGFANLGVSVIKAENSGTSMEYTEVGYIEGQEKLQIKSDSKIIVPFGFQGIYKEYEVKGGNLFKVY